MKSALVVGSGILGSYGGSVTEKRRKEWINNETLI